METIRVFRDGMDDDPNDYNDLQNFAQLSSDNIVADTITAAAKYAGFVTAKVGPAVITVQPGRLYSAGERFASSTVAWTKDFTTVLPVPGLKRIVAVVTFGQTNDQNLIPREFLINEETGQSQPQVVALDRARVANVNVASGTDAPDPTAPVVDAALTVIALVTLSATGVDSVVMQTQNAVPNVQNHETRIHDLELFEARIDPEVSTLASDFAKLRAQLLGHASQDVMTRTLLRLATLEEHDGIPAAAVDSDADFFLTTTKSDLLNPLSDVLVMEGARCPYAAENITQFSQLNPLDPTVMLKGDVLFPAYDRVQRLSVGPSDGSVQISSFTFTTNSMVQKTMTRQRVRYGDPFTVCTNNIWWQTGSFDYNTFTFARAGETFNVINEFTLDVYGSYAHNVVRLQQVWTDTVTEAYWDSVTINHTVPGAQVANTFLNGNDGWLDAVNLYFTSLASTGGINLSICEVTTTGLPDVTKVIAIVDVDRSALQVGRTTISIPPTFLNGGKRYAIVVTSAANHFLATCGSDLYPQGTFFWLLASSYEMGDATRCLAFDLLFANFRAPRALSEMQGLQLVGGIQAIDILADAFTPAACSLTYEVQIAGTWYPLSAATTSVLDQGGSQPPLVPIRVVFLGTTDVMPALRLGGSVCHVTRPKTGFTHVSTTRTLPAPSTDVRVIVRLEFFDAVYHTHDCKILTGGSFATVNNAVSHTDVLQTDGSIERTYLFTPSSTSTYKIKQIGTTTAVTRQYHVGWRKDAAL